MRLVVDADELLKFLLLLHERIEVIPSSDLVPFLREAKQLSPDPKDVQYFAAALRLNCPLWSEDKLLKRQERVKVVNTAELLHDLE